MYMSISSSIVASFGIQEAVKLIKKYDKYNISKYTIPFFIIGTIILQSSIGLTALVGKGYWDFAISRDEYQVLIWVNSQTGYSEHIMVYPSIILPSRAFLNPRSVGTNATHIFNETIVNNTILSELLATEFNYIMVNTSSYPVLTSLLEADPAFTLVYLVSNIRLYRF
ncbi:MAG: hypothetical protein QW327_02240 [Candidatus Odinarchaeota archaeon]